MFIGLSAAVNAGLEKAFVKVAHVPGRANAVFLEVCDHLRMHPLTALQRGEWQHLSQLTFRCVQRCIWYLPTVKYMFLNLTL